MRGQNPILINDFRGLFDRGSKESVPLTYFSDCSNMEFTFKGCKSRGEFLVSYTFAPPNAGPIIGLGIFPRLDGTARRLILQRETAGGLVKLYDADHSAPPFLVATYTTDIDSVSIIPMFDRLYIAALGTNNEHKTDAVIQVYDGVSVARNAGGVAPSGASMTATEPGAGNVSAGIHLYAVAFETPSGFITKPGPAVWTNFTSAGSLNINLAGIPVGPAGTVNRHILATKRIPTYGPPQENFELFFVPGGTLAGNVATTLTIDFFDTELVNSADYLLDQYETIPAGPLFSIGNSLGVAGYITSVSGGVGNSGDKRSIALISKAVEIEAFSVDEGFVVVKPGMGGVLTNGLDLNGTLFLFKESLTAAIQPDLDSAPANWGSPGVIDSFVGTTPFGIALFMGAPFLVNGGAFVVTKFGLQHFNGQYNNVSWAIDERWKNIASFKFFKNSLACVDPDKKRVYVFLSALGGYPNSFLMMDYKEGFTPEQVKWCPWLDSTLTLRGMFTDKDGALRASTSTQIKTVQVRTELIVTETIISFIKTSLLRFNELGYIWNFEHTLIGARGFFNLQVDWFSQDDVRQDLTGPDPILTNPADRFLRSIGNFTSQMASLKLTTNGDTNGLVSGYMDLSSIIVWGHQEGEEYPL